VLEVSRLEVPDAVLVAVGGLRRHEDRLGRVPRPATRASPGAVAARRVARVPWVGWQLRVREEERVLREGGEPAVVVRPSERKDRERVALLELLAAQAVRLALPVRVDRGAARRACELPVGGSRLIGAEQHAAPAGRGERPRLAFQVRPQCADAEALGHAAVHARGRVDHQRRELPGRARPVSEDQQASVARAVRVYPGGAHEPQARLHAHRPPREPLVGAHVVGHQSRVLGNLVDGVPEDDPADGSAGLVCDLHPDPQPKRDGRRLFSRPDVVDLGKEPQLGSLAHDAAGPGRHGDGVAGRNLTARRGQAVIPVCLEPVLLHIELVDSSRKPTAVAAGKSNDMDVVHVQRWVRHGHARGVDGISRVGCDAVDLRRENAGHLEIEHVGG